MAEYKTPKSKEQSSQERQSGAPSAESEGSGILDQAKGVATQVAGQAKSMVGSTFSDRTSRSAAQVSELAVALRTTGDRLEGNLAAPLIGRAADQLERVSRALETSDLRTVIRDVEDFARREPLLFLGGAFLAGVLGARFLRSGGDSAAQWSGSQPSYDSGEPPYTGTGPEVLTAESYGITPEAGSSSATRTRARRGAESRRLPS